MPTDQTAHMLPCSIDAAGPTLASFFQPTRLPDSEAYAATLRGRGLLCMQGPQPVQAGLYQVQSDQDVKKLATIADLLEWKHEHVVVAAGASRLAQAHEWSHVAEALHAPLPLDE